MPWIYLVLIAVVIAFGIGVVVLSRRRAARRVEAATRPAPTPRPAPPEPTGPGAVTAPEVAEAAVLEQGVEADVEAEVVAPASLRERMAKARAVLTGVFAGVRSRSGITDETWDDLEEALLRADVGVGVADALLADLRTRVKAREIADPDALLDALQADMVAQLAGADRALHFADTADGQTNVWLFVGVNGVGKTTTIGKVAKQQAGAGRSVLLAAGDTFRAAAAEQLATWAGRAGAELVRGSEGGDPSAVVFDAVERATARSIDLVLADTAGRLHTKTNLMEELRKVRRVAEKGAGVVSEVLLVIDATTGQNGLTQAREFGAATGAEGSGLTGVVLTKLDGSAKGGIVFAIETELGVPVKLVGIGESIGDLVEFDPEEFVAALFDR
jgi:fused signal recognition particle receptor